MDTTTDAGRPVTLARDYLMSRGARVLDQGWRHSTGEIDLVVADRGVLVACVVRVRAPAGHRDPGVLPAKKVRLLRRLLVRWQPEHGLRVDQIRIDVIVLTWDGTGGYTIGHVRGAGER